MSFSYVDELNDLKDSIDKAYDEYMENVTKIDNICRKHKDNYDKIVNVINSERHSLRSEIRKLYKFLKEFGNIGVQITPFDYVAEDLGYMPYEPYKGKGDSDFQGEKGKFSTYFIFGIPGKAVEAIINRKKNKRLYEQKTIEFGQLQSEWEQDLQKRMAVAKFLEDSEKIADIYRALIATVKDAIEDTIIPELNAIRAFLYADAVKESILYGDDPSGAEPKNIQLFEGSLYDVHYRFVRNTLDYYVIISKFFKDAILTKMIEDRVVTQQEKDDFNKEVDEIKRQLDVLKKNAILEG